MLLLFDDASPTLSAQQIADGLKMSRSATYRYLQSLRSQGLLEEDATRGLYRLGPRVLELARVARKGLGVSEVALPVMERLAATVDEAVLLTRRSANQVVCIERVESQHPVRLSYERGHVLPLHAGASAKVLLAFAPPGEVEALLEGAALEQFTDSTVTDPDLLLAELVDIRTRGFAFSDGEVDAGVRGVAAPILGSDGRVIAGLSVAGPAFRLSDDRVPQVVEAAREAAGEISTQLDVLAG